MFTSTFCSDSATFRLPATIWWDNALALSASLVVFASVYIWLYARLVSGRRPGWLLLPSVLKTTD